MTMAEKYYRFSRYFLEDFFEDLTAGERTAKILIEENLGFLELVCIAAEMNFKYILNAAMGILKTPPKVKEQTKRRYYLDGEEMQSKEIARILGVNPGVVWSRCRKFGVNHPIGINHHILLCVDFPCEGTGKYNYFYDEKRYPLKEVCKKTGRSPQAIRKYLELYGSFEFSGHTVTWEVKQRVRS